MKTYGQFCPVAKASELFCERWTPLIIRDLAQGASRFSELQKGVPLMSPTLLSSRLKQLEAEGIVERRTSGGGKTRTYHLTAAGREFIPMVEALGIWGQRWSRRQLVEGEVDLGLLVWALERGVNPAAFGERRSVVQLDLTDQPDNKRLWWFVNREGACELCVEDPGFEVDLYLACSLPDMIYIIRGDLPLTEALDAGRLDAHGPRRITTKLAKWLNLGPLTKVKSARGERPAAAMR